MKEKLNTNHSNSAIKIQKAAIYAIIIAILFVLPSGLKAQNYYSYYFYYPQNFHINIVDYYDYDQTMEAYYNPFNHLKYFKKSDSLFKKPQVNNMKIRYQNPQKDINPYLGKEVTYDKNGNTTIFIKYNKKGNVTFKSEAAYNDKRIMLFYKTYKKNAKISTWYENILDEKGRVIESRTYNKDGMPKIIRTFIYNEKSKITENNSYRGKDKTLFNRIVNKYYSNGEIESTANYNGKGKLKKFWSYACNNKAEEVKNLKDTVKVCKISDFDKDGNFTLTDISTGEDGQIYKSLKKYNKDSILIESNYYNRKNQLTSKTSNYKTASGWTCKYLSYNTKNQNPNYEYIFIYNENKLPVNCTLTYFKGNGVIRYKKEFQYNDNGFISDFKYFKKGGVQLSFSTEYERNQSGLPMIVYNKDKEGKIKFKTTYQYQ